MPVVAVAQHGRAARTIVEGIDFSCRLNDVSLALNRDPIDVTQFCAGMKQHLTQLPDGKLSLGGFLDAGTQGTHAVIGRRLRRGQHVAWTVQTQGHMVGGHAASGTAIIAELAVTHTVAGVTTASMELLLDGDLWVCRTLVPIAPAVVASGPWAMAQCDRAQLDEPYASVPYGGLLHVHYRNESGASRTLRLFSHSSPMAAGAEPAGATEHGSVTVPAGEVAAGAFGTTDDPLAVGRYVAAFIEDASNGEQHRPYIGLVDLELSVVSEPMRLPVGPDGQTGWSNLDAAYWDNGVPVFFVGSN